MVGVSGGFWEVPSCVVGLGNSSRMGGPHDTGFSFVYLSLW